MTPPDVWNQWENIYFWKRVQVMHPNHSTPVMDNLSHPTPRRTVYEWAGLGRAAYRSPSNVYIDRVGAQAGDARGTLFLFMSHSTPFLPVRSTSNVSKALPACWGEHSAVGQKGGEAEEGVHGSGARAVSTRHAVRALQPFSFQGAPPHRFDGQYTTLVPSPPRQRQCQPVVIDKHAASYVVWYLPCSTSAVLPGRAPPPPIRRKASSRNGFGSTCIQDTALVPRIPIDRQHLAHMRTLAHKRNFPCFQGARRTNSRASSRKIPPSCHVLAGSVYLSMRQRLGRMWIKWGSAGRKERRRIWASAGSEEEERVGAASRESKLKTEGS
ncbi:hypothetical protein C8R44DRAFT_742175 [Mycena epipterygia]|nr:hypothetical protein C8R44DRAFT_742175 [Mycena epipterygia]